MKPYKGRIENWVIGTWFSDKDVVIGDLYDNPAYPDGHEIRTSFIVSRNGDEVETGNSICKLGKPAND